MKQIGFKLKLSNLKTCRGSIAKQNISYYELLVTKHAFKVHELVKLLGKQPWRRILFLKGVNEAEPEIKKLDIPVASNIIELETSIHHPFYKGKGIVEITRSHE